MKTIQDRLRWCLKNGRMTVADLAVWCNRSYPTVRTWVLWGVEPRGPRTEQLFERITLLERLIHKGKDFPVPYWIGHFDRPYYIKKVRDGHYASLPRSGVAR